MTTWVPPASSSCLPCLVGLPLIVTAIIVVNNLRDIETDRVARKRTLAVLLGHAFAAPTAPGGAIRFGSLCAEYATSRLGVSPSVIAAAAAEPPPSNSSKAG